MLQIITVFLKVPGRPPKGKRELSLGSNFALIAVEFSGEQITTQMAEQKVENIFMSIVSLALGLEANQGIIGSRSRDQAVATGHNNYNKKP